jgi:hypothetical protein
MLNARVFRLNVILAAFFYACTYVCKKQLKKFAHLTLMKLTPGVDFTIMCNFYTCRSQKHKATNDLTVIFVLLGSKHAKAARKMLVKLTPD